MGPDNVNFGLPQQKSFFQNLGGYFAEFLETIVIFGAIFATIYLFIAQFHKVSGNSMVPILHTGDYLVTEKISYRFSSPQRGEIIVLQNPKDESQDFIKRIIALPGDTIQIKNNTLYVNGQIPEENYLPINTPTHSGAFLTEGKLIKAADNQYFVLGDNRQHSSDSRDWGPVTKQEIVGKAFFRYYPIPDIGLLTNK